VRHLFGSLSLFLPFSHSEEGEIKRWKKQFLQWRKSLNLIYDSSFTFFLFLFLFFQRGKKQSHFSLWQHYHHQQQQPQQQHHLLLLCSLKKNVFSSDKSRNCSIPWKDSSSYSTNFFEIVTRQQQLTIIFCPSCHTKRTSFVSVLKAFLKPKLVNDLSNVILQLIKGLFYFK